MLTLIIVSLLTVLYFGAVLWLAKSILSGLLFLQARQAEVVVENRVQRRRRSSPSP